MVAFRMQRPAVLHQGRAIGMSRRLLHHVSCALQQQQAQPQLQVTVIGGGASGLTAAFFAAQAGAKVTVLERTREAGKKILMSGGSRCNVLPVSTHLADDFFTESSTSAMRAIFASWPLEQCRDWLEDPYEGVGLALEVEEETNKYFPASNSSREVRDKLLTACIRHGVTVRFNSSVEQLQQVSADSQPAGKGSSASHFEHQNNSSSGGSSDVSSSRNGLEGEHLSHYGHSPAGTHSAPAWLCTLQDGTQHLTDRLVVATGGLSFPAVGTDGTGHRLLSKLGHTLHEPYPALTPLTGPHPAGHQLAGLSLYDVELSVHLPHAPNKPKAAHRTGLLFTHRGYSGPSILDLSHYTILPPPRLSPRTGRQSATPIVSNVIPSSVSTSSSTTASSGAPPQPSSQPQVRASLRVSWTGEDVATWEERLMSGGIAQVSTILKRSGVRERLADALCEELGLEGRRMCELKRTERQALVQALTAYELPYSGSEGYKKAEVSGGGVPLKHINCATMESKVLPGVYLCGEILDVFGRIGGFNFYWAWVSGRLAGLGAAKPAPAIKVEALQDVTSTPAAIGKQRRRGPRGHVQATQSLAERSGSTAWGT